MDWNNEVKILSKALKDNKHEKNKLVADMGNYTGEKSHRHLCLIAQRELIIQNIQARLEEAKKQLYQEEKLNTKKRV